jgi:hypothetical protein
MTRVLTWAAPAATAATIPMASMKSSNGVEKLKKDENPRTFREEKGVPE